MKKALKIIGKALIGIVAFVVLLVLTLPFWIGPVVKGVSGKVVPGITGTDFHMGEFGFNIYNGHLHVGDTQLANPTNYSEKNAVDLGKLDVNVAMTSLLSKKLRIESIDLDGLMVYSSPSAGNFREIADNASGGEKAEDASAAGESVEESAVEEPADEQKQGGGVQIDRITLKNITIKYGPIPVKVPMTIELTDIGKDKPEGASWADVWDDVYGSVMKSVGAVGGAIGDAGKAAAGAASDAAGKAADAVGDAAGKTADAVGDAAGKAVDAVGDAAGKAVDAIGGLFK